jgi:hypothetical protein
MVYRRDAEIADGKIFSFAVERTTNEKLLSRCAAGTFRGFN